MSAVILALVLLLFAAPARAENKKEERGLDFKRWLEQEVKYIITDEEKSVFQKLQTVEERLNFIEQFWLRRDPTPGTIENEYKEEHYRRIAYANQHFASGIPGWKTDRGMIYIKFGPPDQIEAYPSGGHYSRPFWEGGGDTSTYPFEIWRYRHIAGVGQDVEIEFVDDTLSGEYRITTNPYDKDALLRIPNAGLTLTEQLGLSSKVDRIVRKTNPMPGHNPILIGYGRVKDQPFEKLQLLTNLQRPPEIKFKDLEALVTTRITYNQLPFRMTSSFFKMGQDHYVVPLSIELRNRDLQYIGKGGVHRAEVNLYGRLTDLGGRVVSVFEETLATEITEQELSRNLWGTSLYQKNVEVRPGRYKLELVLKDKYSEKVGSTQTVLVVPRLPEEELALSSVVLALRVEAISAARSTELVIGGARVVQNPSGEFAAGRPFAAYFQIYNLAFDQASSQPSALIRYAIIKDGQEVSVEEDEINQVRWTGSEITVARYLSTEKLQPGEYRLKVKVQDRISGRSAEQEAKFTIKASQMAER